MADPKSLGTLIVDGLREDVALLTWIAGLNDRALAREYRRIQAEYDNRCADYAESGEEYMPRPPRSLPFLLEAMTQRLEA